MNVIYRLLRHQYDPSNIWWRLQVMKLLLMWFSLL
jgi:hypothetical protein